MVPLSHHCCSVWPSGPLLQRLWTPEHHHFPNKAWQAVLLEQAKTLSHFTLQFQQRFSRADTMASLPLRQPWHF